ncbi:hypothetical protein Ate02nite_65160 [Paractinoplanes tereljensis]|uniref:Uncharacterized protein n=1 Tax=Paractinoplanes tereljensis TaxID=571912 RepID=A0A919NTL8_9ACTN|nr:hypothetical protein Ate02nite_65160 [Actinoplanes tereljensis]
MSGAGSNDRPRTEKIKLAIVSLLIVLFGVVGLILEGGSAMGANVSSHAFVVSCVAIVQRLAKNAGRHRILRAALPGQHGERLTA